MQTDRRTRDRVRLFFWAVLTVVCLVAVMVARQQQEQGLQRKIDAAQERAVRFTQNVLADRLDAKRVSQPIGRSGYDELLTELKHGLFNDQRVVRVRVWRDDGMLVFTTDHPAEIGNVTADDAGVDLRPALRGDLTSIVVSESFARDDATTPEPTSLLSTFIPLRSTDKADVFGAVEIDNDYTMMVDATEHPWKQVQIAFAILALICLVMAIVSLVWSHRPAAAETDDGFGPSRREVRAVAKDEKKASAAAAEAAKLRERVKELEGKTKTHSEQQAELEKLRNRVAEFESRPAPAQAAHDADPAEMAQLKAHATQLEEQARGAESRVTQLQSRVTEMEAQLRVTTDQLRMAQQRAEEAPAVPAANVAPEIQPEVQAELQAKLAAAAEVEQLLRDELEAARGETQRVQHERDELERAHAEEARSQQGQLDQVRAQARLAEEERQRILAEGAKSPTAQEAISADAESRIRELTQQLERSEAERAMLRAGRPETVYEARNRQLEDEITVLRERLDGPGPHGAPPTGVDSGAVAALEERLAAAEERARDAERRLDEAAAKPRSRSRASRRANANAEASAEANGNGKVDAEAEATIQVKPEADPQDEATPVDDGPPVPTVDGSELRSRLVRSTDARRRGISTPTPTPTPGPKRR